MSLAEGMMVKILLILCGLFYALLCVFSVVTGLMYASGGRELNPLELSERFMSRFAEPDRLRRFTVTMGWVTFAVGVAQGITAWALFDRGGPLCYGIALGFTLFSIASVAFKLKGKLSAFPLLKCAAYAAILAVLLLRASRALFSL
jgi:hypothetical protein